MTEYYNVDGTLEDVHDRRGNGVDSASFYGTSKADGTTTQYYTDGHTLEYIVDKEGNYKHYNKDGELIETGKSIK